MPTVLEHLGDGAAQKTESQTSAQRATSHIAAAGMNSAARAIALTTGRRRYPRRGWQSLPRAPARADGISASLALTPPSESTLIGAVPLPPAACNTASVKRNLAGCVSSCFASGDNSTFKKLKRSWPPR